MMGSGLSLGHDLDAHPPFREVTLLDRGKQIALGIIRVSTCQASGVGRGQVLDTLLGLVVPFDPMTLTRRADQAVSVAAEAVHVTVAVWNATVRKQDRDLVQRLRRVRPEVPHHLRAFQVGLGQTFLGVNEVREFKRVTDKENRRVVPDDVPVTFFGIELDREAARVTLGVCRTSFATDGGETHENWRLLAHGLKQFSAGVLRDIAINRECTVSARTFRVHAAFRNVLAIEVCKFLDQVKIVE